MMKTTNATGDHMRGARIRNARMRLGMSHRDLSEASGVDLETICCLEEDKEPFLTVGQLLDLVTALQTDVDTLFFDTAIHE